MLDLMYLTGRIASSGGHSEVRGEEVPALK